MALLYSPPASHGHFYYETAQVAAFAVYVALLLGQGYRRGYPWRNWLPLVAAATLALLVGCQLVCLPPAAWLSWLRSEVATQPGMVGGPRSVVGGAAASLLAVLALRRALGFRGWAVLDAFAGPLCWALAVQCVGCLLVGCCWGEVAALGSPGLRYGPGTLPYLAQQAHGLLPAGVSYALPVVPTQLYQLLLCAGAGVVLHMGRRAAWPGGSRYLLAMGLLCLGRFFIEFWRDPAGEPLLAAPLALAGMQLLGLQWLLLAESLALLGSWGWLVARQVAPAAAAPIVATLGYPALVGVGLLAATARLAPASLNRPETLVLQGLLLAVLVAEGHSAWAKLSRWAPRLVGLPLSLLLSGALLLSTAQAPAPQQAASATPPPSKTLILSGGVLGNSHDAEEDILANSSGCSGSQPLRLHQQVRAGGGEIAVEKAYATGQTSTWGGGLWVGQQQVAIQTLPTSHYQFIAHDTTLRYLLADIHLYREIHTGQAWSSFGFRGGLHLGSLGYYSYFDNGNTRNSAWLLPELMLSYGNPRLLYGQADFCYGAENTLGAYTGRLALGSGLGQAGGSQVLAGYAHSPHRPTPSMGFVSATLRLPGGTGLSALSLEPYFATDFGEHQQFSLKLNYRLAR
ncbi:hypothetical protein GO988_02370 [Hymenobacter sp. HMF4947]|uniref:Prolipoprotein diacylglyceryl transferase n=1 Tax=Hymenobacter ginkgonis TaxID=2682976 RepID=A0A7K1T9U6_9BACT|nr:prolipoprotein diacylglyceryl transferase family protein [Hymenobacter ginkgonis]MVN75165.1 hypothetical protein [Hymenobacter ginkgonis]